MTVYRRTAQTMAFMQRLASIRRQRGLTQQQLAERMGIGQSMVANMETSARHGITLDNVLRYANAVGADVRITARQSE